MVKKMIFRSMLTVTKYGKLLKITHLARIQALFKTMTFVRHGFGTIIIVSGQDYLVQSV